MEPLESPANVITLPVHAAAILAKGRFVSAAGAHSADGARAIGVTADNYAADEPVAVVTAGITAVETGGAFAAGDEVQSDSTGRAIALASGKANGIALTASSGAGKFVAVKILSLLLILMSSFFAAPVAQAQTSQYELVSETKTASMIVASSIQFPLRSIVNTKADSLTIVAKLSDSVTARFEFLATSPDGAYLDNTIVIPNLTATNAAKYTTATIAVGARHQLATLAMTAKSNRATTANITADGVKVWLYYHTNKR